MKTSIDWPKGTTLDTVNNDGDVKIDVRSKDVVIVEFGDWKLEIDNTTKTIKHG